MWSVLCVLKRDATLHNQTPGLIMWHKTCQGCSWLFLKSNHVNTRIHCIIVKYTVTISLLCFVLTTQSQVEHFVEFSVSIRRQLSCKLMKSIFILDECFMLDYNTTLLQQHYADSFSHLLQLKGFCHFMIDRRKLNGFL